MNTVRIPQPIGAPRRRPGAVAADKAYACRRIRDWLKDHRIKDVIPTKSNQEPNPAFDKEAYRRRNVVERCIGALKECRRVATRFEKLAVNFAAMVKLAMMRLYFRSVIDAAWRASWAFGARRTNTEADAIGGPPLRSVRFDPVPSRPLGGPFAQRGFALRIDLDVGRRSAVAAFRHRPRAIPALDDPAECVWDRVDRV